MTQKDRAAEIPINKPAPVVLRMGSSSRFSMFNKKRDISHHWDALVSVREHIESDESFVIQERWPDSGEGH